MFQYAFPVPKTELDSLVYLHEFELTGSEPVDSSVTESAVREWRHAHHRGAALRIDVHDDGSSTIEDTRRVDEAARIKHLNRAETLPYVFLDGGVKETLLGEVFERAYREAFEQLGGGEGMRAVVNEWLLDDLLLLIDGRLVSLALQASRMKPPYVEAGAPDVSEPSNHDLVQIT
jgi:hypothetical protein